MESISINKIVCESNRKYTKDEGFDQLVNSIQQYGIIQAPTVRRMDDEQYKVIAGRRRIEAARWLKMTYVDCVIREESDPVDIDEEIALTENVNRQEMHPLDEAGAFKRMADAGNPIEEIARYYARSPSAIYKRLRLCGLVEELKSMLRDGTLNITGAAVLAELPDEGQQEFYELYKDTSLVEINIITSFINKKQHYVIKPCMKNCEGCNKRTHNDGNELFEECNDLRDICLDPDCYRVKWYEMIASRLEEQKIQLQEAGLQTDEKIVFFNGIPEMIYKKASFVNITDSEKQHIKYEILRNKDYDFTEETTRKKDTCWVISEHYEIGVDVRRVGYKARPPREKKEITNTGNDNSSKTLNGGADIKKYGREAIETVAKERGVTPAELTKNLYDKKIWHFTFTSDVSDLVCKHIINNRIEMEANGVEPPDDYLSMFLLLSEEEGYFHGTFKETNFTDEQKQWYKNLIGNKNICKISAGLNDEAQKLFHFLILCIGFLVDMPTLENIKDINNENIFWKYAKITKEKYRDLYLKAAREIISDAMDNEQKKESKKKTGAAPSSKQKKKQEIKIKIDDDFDDDDPLGPPNEDEGYPDIDTDDEE